MTRHETASGLASPRHRRLEEARRRRLPQARHPLDPTPFRRWTNVRPTARRPVRYAALSPPSGGAPARRAAGRSPPAHRRCPTDGGARGYGDRMASPFIEIEVDNRVVKVTNPDRVYFPESGATKLDLVDYYLAVGPGIVNALFERPTHAPPLPDRAVGREGPPEAASVGCPGLGRDRPAALPALEPHRRRAVRDRARRGDLGGPDVDGRVPPLEQPPRGPREARRVADRPRPRSAERLRPGAARRRGRPRDPRRARRGRLPQDQRRQGPPHLRPRSRPTTATRRYAVRRSPSPARSSAGCPTT